MHRVVVGHADRKIVVHAQHCVKTGEPTIERIIIRGSLVPDWTWAILPFAFLIWIFVSLMASRKYAIEVPFQHRVHDRWKMLRRVAWLVVLAGPALAWGAASAGVGGAGMLLGISVIGVVIGLVNATEHNIGVRLVNRDEVALTRVHAEFAADVLLIRQAQRQVN